jgi:hypothetical protein
MGFNIPVQSNIKSDLEKKGLKDTVRSVREIVHSIPVEDKLLEFDKITSDELSFFNSSGFELEKYIYKDGMLFSTIKNEYDQNNNKTFSKDYTSKGELYLLISYLTDDIAHTVEATYDRTSQKKFDHNRNPIEIEFEKYYQNLYTKILYKYNHLGTLLFQKYYKPDGSLSGKYEFRYDYRGNKSSVKYFSTEVKLSWEKKYTYNDKGDPEICKYFVKNRLASISTFVYEYDDKDNWTKRTEIKDIKENFFTQDLDGNTIVTTRDLEYF